MKFKSALSVLSLSCLLGACASIHPGKFGKAVGNKENFPLKVSAESLPNHGSESFVLVELTLENTSDDWVKIHRSEVLIDEDSLQEMSVVVGKDLEDWRQAMQLEANRQRYNEEWARLGILLGGATALGLSGNDNYTPALTTGVVTHAVVSEHQRQKLQLVESEKVPPYHIYQPFSVPGKMYLRRWLLLNKKPKSRISKLVIQFESATGEKGSYAFNL